MDETKEYFGLAASACLADVFPIRQLMYLLFFISVQTFFCATDSDWIFHTIFDLIP